MNRNAELADRLLAEAALRPAIADMLVEASAIALLDGVIDCRGCRLLVGCKQYPAKAYDYCTNGDKYVALPIVRLYKVTP